MPVLSLLRRSMPISMKTLKTSLLNDMQVRNGSKNMWITPSRWGWHKFKDLFHFYVMLGVIPLAALVTYVNIFIGPAQLAEIPEGYEPKKWEYHKHPISRFMAKIYASHQEEYEKYLHWMYEENEKKEMTLIEKKVKMLMAERGDSTTMYYSAPTLKYIKMVRKEYDDKREYTSDN